MESLVEMHYCPLPSQGTTYLSAYLTKTDGTPILLTAALRRKVYCTYFEYDSTFSRINPITKDLPFAYISRGEMCSIDAFSRSQNSNDFTVGITVIKGTSENSCDSYLNLYCDHDIDFGGNLDVNLESITQNHNCDNIELDFIPYGLYHCQLPPHQIDETYQVVWLLCGSDHKVHMYRNTSDRPHAESPIEEFFPEFTDIPSIVLSLDIIYYGQYHKRISCIGCECGYVKFTIIDTRNNQLLRDFTLEFDNPVTDIHFFTVKNPKVNPGYHHNTDAIAIVASTEIPEIDMVITTGILPAELFLNVINDGNTNRHILKDSHKYDVATCSVAADIDFDSRKEIIIGTYGQCLLLYKCIENSWELVAKRNVPNPVHKLFYIDLTQAGVSELVVVTSKGAHIFQHDPEYVSKILYRRLLSMKSERKDEENFDVSVS